MGAAAAHSPAVIVCRAPRAAKLVACRDDLSHIDKCFTHNTQAGIEEVKGGGA